jgi:hypothetical protein
METEVAMRWVLPFILLSLVLAACAPLEADTQEIEMPDTFELETPFWIKMDQTVSQQGGSLEVSFIDVTEDSRCPVGTNIQCVWAGQVTTRLQTQLGDAAAEVSVTFPNSQMGTSTAVLYDQYTIEVLAVEPVPRSMDPIERSAYRAQLIVTEGLPTPTPTPVTFSLGTPFWMIMDDRILLANGSLSLSFIDVPKDQRCPVGDNVDCAQQGQVIVWLQAYMDGGSDEAWLTLPDANQGLARGVLFDTYTIELLAVEPERTSLDRIEHTAYRVQLIVTDDVATGSNDNQ